MARPIRTVKRTKRTYLGSGAGSMKSSSGPTAKKAKAKKGNRPYTGVLPSDKPSARKKPKSTRTKATELFKKSLITPRVIKVLKKPAVQKAIKTAVRKAIETSPLATPPGLGIGVGKAVSKVIKKRRRPAKKAATIRRRAKR